MQHQLGFQAELRARAEPDRLQRSSEEQPVPVIVVDPQHPAVLHFLFLLDQLTSTHGDRQAVFHDQAVAPGGNQQITVGLIPGNDAFRIDSGLCRREGVVAEAHPLGSPTIGFQRDPIGLHPPAADAAIDQLGAAQALELRHLHHTEAVFIPHAGVQPSQGNATAAFDRKCAAQSDGVDPLIDRGDGFVATLLLLLG